MRFFFTLHLSLHVAETDTDLNNAQSTLINGRCNLINGRCTYHSTAIVSLT